MWYAYMYFITVYHICSSFGSDFDSDYLNLNDAISALKLLHLLIAIALTKLKSRQQRFLISL